MHTTALFLTFVSLLFLSATPALAECSYPAGETADTFYDAQKSMFLKCNGTDWAPITTAGAAKATPQIDIVTSWWTSAFPKKTYPQHANIEQEAKKIQNLLNISAEADFNQTVDTVRHFIHKNSEHNMDEEFYSYWHDIPQLIQKIAAASLTPGAAKPHMECSTRVAVMYHILKSMNIDSRPVVIYPDGNGDLSHTYLSVRNPQTDQWHIQDPDYDVFWVFKDTKERASTKDLLFRPIRKTFVPCTDNAQCGYNNEIEKIIPYFGLVARLDIGADDYDTQVNLDRFGVEKLSWFMRTPQPYCDLFSKGCTLGENDN